MQAAVAAVAVPPGRERLGRQAGQVTPRMAATGPPRSLTADLARDGVVRWRCRDLQARIEREFEISFHERTIGKLLTKANFRRLSVRPQHPERDVAAQQAFKGASLTW